MWYGVVNYSLFRKELEVFFDNLQLCTIVPIVVLDGECDRYKFQTRVGRKDKRSRRITKNIYDPDLVEELNKHGVLPLFSGEVLLEIAKEKRIECLCVVGDADLTMARLANFIDAPVLTQDSDFVVYNLSKGYAELKTCKYKRLTMERDEEDGYVMKSYVRVELYKISNVETQWQVDAELIKSLPVLLGCDWIYKWAFQPALQRIKAKMAKKKESKIQQVDSWTANRKRILKTLRKSEEVVDTTTESEDQIDWFEWLGENSSYTLDQLIEQFMVSIPSSSKEASEQQSRLCLSKFDNRLRTEVGYGRRERVSILEAPEMLALFKTKEMQQSRVISLISCDRLDSRFKLFGRPRVKVLLPVLASGKTQDSPNKCCAHLRKICYELSSCYFSKDDDKEDSDKPRRYSVQEFDRHYTGNMWRYCCTFQSELDIHNINPREEFRRLISWIDQDDLDTDNAKFRLHFLLETLLKSDDGMVKHFLHNGDESWEFIHSCRITLYVACTYYYAMTMKRWDTLLVGVVLLACWQSTQDLSTLTDVDKMPEKEMNSGMEMRFKEKPAWMTTTNDYAEMCINEWICCLEMATKFNKLLDNVLPTTSPSFNCEVFTGLLKHVYTKYPRLTRDQLVKADVSEMFKDIGVTFSEMSLKLINAMLDPIRARPISKKQDNNHAARDYYGVHGLSSYSIYHPHRHEYTNTTCRT